MRGIFDFAIMDGSLIGCARQPKNFTNCRKTDLRLSARTFSKRMTEAVFGEYPGIHTKSKKPRYRNDNGAFFLFVEVRSGFEPL